MLNTGFSEITEERVKYAGNGFWYCEIALTGECNFHCKYCNRLRSEIDYESIRKFIYAERSSLRHIQLTGGEPTKSIYLWQLCNFIKAQPTKIKLGLSTNGSASLDLYEDLHVDMFSISLDDYDTRVLINRGYENPEKVIDNIKALSKLKYVNVGIVIDSINQNRIEQIIQFVLMLGVHDIKLSVSTHDEVMPVFSGNYDYSKYPILNYRVSRFKQGKSMRGINANFKCEIAKSDISIVGTKHYPCLVYAREKGSAIGDMSGDIKADRLKWYENHVPKSDPICSNYCMDFKCDFNLAVGMK
jgi:MoaA/NifB/PqqE/SkfB family radical SAM enzyme